MKQLCLTYSVIPSFEESVSLHVEMDKENLEDGKIWIQVVGLGNDFIKDAPWWTDHKVSPSKSGTIDPSFAKSVFDALSGVVLTAVPTGDFGCDGTTFELEFRSGCNSAKYEWWCELPSEWLSLLPLVKILDRYISAKRGGLRGTRY